MKRFCLMLLCLLLLGCAHGFTAIDPDEYRAVRVTDVPTEQPTPEETIEPTDATPTPSPEPLKLRERYGIPESVQFDRTEGLLTIAGNPAVEVPDVYALPQGTATAATFDQTTVDRVFAACMGNRAAYVFPEGAAYTQAMLDEALAAVAEYSGMAKVKSVRYRCETETARLKALKRSAPVDNPYPIAEPTLRDGTVLCQTLPETAYASVFAVDNGEVPQLSYLYRPASTLDFMDSGAKNFVQSVTRESQVPGLKPAGVTLKTSPYTAMQTVRAFLARAGLWSFEPFSIGFYENARSNAQWYCVTCKRTQDGVPITSMLSSSAFALMLRPDIYSFSEDMSFYGELWTYERLVVLVSDSGIRRVHWQNPIAVTAAPSETALIPFSEIVDMTYAILYELGRDTHIARTATVERITLSVCVLPDAETNGQGSLVPVWGVTYTYGAEGQAHTVEPRTILIRADTGEVLTGSFRGITFDAATIPTMPYGALGSQW